MGQSTSKQRVADQIHINLDKQIINTKCECRIMLLYGYIHKIEKMHNLSYPVPNGIYTICALYHNIICPNKYLLRFRSIINIQDEYNTKESLE